MPPNLINSAFRCHVTFTKSQGICLPKLYTAVETIIQSEWKIHEITQQE
jgi:hypothetical protein